VKSPLNVGKQLGLLVAVINIIIIIKQPSLDGTYKGTVMSDYPSYARSGFST
jgi:hypothetical protein